MTSDHDIFEDDAAIPKSRSKAKPQLAKYPETCDVEDCEKPTGVAFVLAYDARGKRICTNGSAVLDSKLLNPPRWNATVRPGFEFIRWIARCDDCYQRDLDRRYPDRIRIAG